MGLPAVEYKKKIRNAAVFLTFRIFGLKNVEVVLGIHNRFVINTINKIVDKIYSASNKILCSSNGFVENISARGVPREKAGVLAAVLQ